MKYFVVILFLTLLVAGCQTRYNTISQRPVAGVMKPGERYAHGRIPSSGPKQTFVEASEVRIEKVEPRNETGSLFNPNNQGNYLLLDRSPIAVGQTLNVKVVPLRSDLANTSANTNAPGQGAANPDPQAEQDQFVKEMLAALPQLDAGDSNPKLVTSIPLQVTELLENGDVLAMFRRSSRSSQDARDISAKVRIPYAALATLEHLTTQHLTDVHWLDAIDGEVTERYSSTWEDEYSLRMSGFNEARSLQARQLEDKRMQLQNLRDRMRNELISLGKERKKMASERDVLTKYKNEAEEKAKALEEQQTKLQEELNSLKTSSNSANLTTPANEKNSEEKPAAPSNQAAGG